MVRFRSYGYQQTYKKQQVSALKSAPMVFPTRARQVCKSTLAKEIIAKKSGARYITFAEPSLLLAAKRDPSGFLEEVLCFIRDKKQSHLQRTLLPYLFRHCGESASNSHPYRLDFAIRKRAPFSVNIVAARHRCANGGDFVGSYLQG